VGFTIDDTNNYYLTNPLDDRDQEDRVGLLGVIPRSTDWAVPPPEATASYTSVLLRRTHHHLMNTSMTIACSSAPHYPPTYDIFSLLTMFVTDTQ
jgi:hypothetical protein